MESKPIRLEVISGKTEKTIINYDPGKGKKNLKELLCNAGILLDTPCGGKGICGKCLVQWNGVFCLACETWPEKDGTVRVQTRETEVCMDAPRLPEEPLKEGLGLALDIGTTTVAAFLYDLKAGTCLSMAGGPNAQSVFGADVISRIQYAQNDQKLLQETAVIREQVFDLVQELCKKAQTKAQERTRERTQEKTQERTEETYTFADIHYVTVAGNTVMQHIYAAMSPKSIGVAPFQPLSLFGEQIIAEPTMYFCPCISGYVGGDTTAGILSTGIYESEDLVLLADLGTNCEFALGNKNGFLCCSAPAGPAFETATKNGKLFGSELIGTVAGMLAEGKIDETGRLLEPDESGRITSADVRGLQLAKASVRGAIETMLELLHIRAEEITRVLVAGGFGMHLDLDQVLAIGMFPQEFEGKTEFVGNSAGAGACLALAEENRKKLSHIAEICLYEELSASQLFNEKYFDAMEF